MKLLVVCFALTIFFFLWSQAFVLKDESNSKVAQFKQELKQDKEKLTGAFLKKLVLVGQSDIDKALGSWTHDKVEKVQQDTLPTKVKEIKRPVSSAFWDLKAADGLHTMQNKGVTQRTALPQALESHQNPVLEKLNHFFRHTLVEKCTELNEKLDKVLKRQLEEMQPHAEKIQNWAQKAQGSLESFADHMQEDIKREAKKARMVLAQSAARVREEFQKQGEAFTQWVRRTPLFPKNH